jgi:copper chaperone
MFLATGGEIMVRETLRIEGMSCDHCVMRVGRAIASVQGVIEVDINLKNNKAVVDFEETITDIEEIKSAVREAGYNTL